jgi:uncharacterized protein YbjT (DUF2867 family)
MNQKPGTVLVVGSSGKFAGLVVPELAKRGVKIRGLVRKSSESDEVIEKGASEIAVGNLADPRSMNQALRGVDSVFYISPAFIPDEAEIGRANVKAAKDAGVRRFVFSSVIHPILSELSNHAAKASVEEQLLDSGMEYVFLHPAMFFQNFASSWPRVLETHTFAEPWSTETRFSRVDFRDVAEVAAIALTEDRLTYGTFELCAPGRLNRWDVAELMTEALGKKVRAVELDSKNGGEDRQPGNVQSASIQRMLGWYDRHPLLGSPLILSAILEREARSLQSYFRELAQQQKLNEKN